VDTDTFKEYELDVEHNLKVLQQAYSDKIYHTKPVRRGEP